MFDKAKQLYQLQKKAKEVQKDLKNTEVEARSSDGTIHVIISGDQKIKQIKIDEIYFDQSKKRELEEKLVRVIAEGLSRAQAVAAEKTKGLMGDLGINVPGL